MRSTAAGDVSRETSPASLYGRLSLKQGGPNPHADGSLNSGLTAKG